MAGRKKGILIGLNAYFSNDQQKRGKNGETVNMHSQQCDTSADMR